MASEEDSNLVVKIHEDMNQNILLKPASTLSDLSLEVMTRVSGYFCIVQRVKMERVNKRIKSCCNEWWSREKEFPFKCIKNQESDHVVSKDFMSFICDQNNHGFIPTGYLDLLFRCPKIKVLKIQYLDIAMNVEWQNKAIEWIRVHGATIEVIECIRPPMFGLILLENLLKTQKSLNSIKCLDMRVFLDPFLDGGRSVGGHSSGHSSGLFPGSQSSPLSLSSTNHLIQSPLKKQVSKESEKVITFKKKLVNLVSAHCRPLEGLIIDPDHVTKLNKHWLILFDHQVKWMKVTSLLREDFWDRKPIFVKLELIQGPIAINGNVAKILMAKRIKVENIVITKRESDLEDWFADFVTFTGQTVTTFKADYSISGATYYFNFYSHLAKKCPGLKKLNISQNIPGKKSGQVLYAIMSMKNLIELRMACDAIWINIDCILISLPKLSVVKLVNSQLRIQHVVDDFLLRYPYRSVTVYGDVRGPSHQNLTYSLENKMDECAIRSSFFKHFPNSY